MSGDEGEERGGGERPDWLGPPGEHGGEYRPSGNPNADLLPEAGCCLFQAAGSLGVVLSVGLSAYSLLL